MTAHAKLRPPSAANRWLSCPASSSIMELYPNEPTEASIKGDTAHRLLDTAINWGITPDYHDIDIVYSVMFAVEWINKTREEYGKGCEVYTEQTLDIPETGEFGTTDVIFVTKDLIHVVDYKNGYVPVDIYMNAQLLCYLLGAIAKWGERKKYRISVIQPNYVHVDGKIRHFDVTPEKLQWFRDEVAFSMTKDIFVAGKHCKTSYCPHRANCAVFKAWAQENLKLAYYPSDVNSLNDDELSEALDQADILQGWRETLRGEALRRILHQDRHINGYKIVRGKRNRDFFDDNARDIVFDKLKELGATNDELYDRAPISVAGVERVVKRIFKPQGRTAWEKGMEVICGPDMLASQNQSLTLEKATDGRRPYTKGSEFGPLKQPTDTSNTSNTNRMKDVL